MIYDTIVRWEENGKVKTQTTTCRRMEAVQCIVSMYDLSKVKITTYVYEGCNLIETIKWNEVRR